MFFFCDMACFTSNNHFLGYVMDGRNVFFLCVFLCVCNLNLFMQTTDMKNTSNQYTSVSTTEKLAIIAKEEPAVYYLRMCDRFLCNKYRNVNIVSWCWKLGLPTSELLC